MNERPFFSVVVPVYNVESFLPACLSSILCQKVVDWECILVDDGSQDSSLQICYAYARKDTRFRVVHKDNGGVSSARNAGLRAAKGEWIMFADADDTLEPDAFCVFARHATEDVGLVMAGYVVLTEQGAISYGPQRLEERKISRDEALREMYHPADLRYQGFLWCKLFRREIIEKAALRFCEQIFFNEDRLFCTQYICACTGKIAYTTQPVYRYVHRSTGAMGSLRKGYNRKYATDFDAFIKMYEEVKQNTSDSALLSMAKEGILSSYYTNILFMEKFNSYDADICQHMRKQLWKMGLISFTLKQQLKHVLGNMLRVCAPQVMVRRKAVLKPEGGVIPTCWLESPERINKPVSGKVSLLKLAA